MRKTYEKGTRITKILFTVCTKERASLSSISVKNFVEVDGSSYYNFMYWFSFVQFIMAKLNTTDDTGNSFNATEENYFYTRQQTC